MSLYLSVDIISRELEHCTASRENEKPHGAGEFLWKLLWCRVAVKRETVLVKVT